jgi:indolepyruvate ferredoxin oxidoreductase
MPQLWRGTKFAPITKLYHRDKLFDAMNELSQVSGVTILINDQQCAAEKRRERKRGIQAEPNVFALIHEEVCEGCGNCGELSNCMSLHPVETEFGPKTRIHQASCNKDYSCLDGDCPSFMTVEVEPGTGLTPKQQPSLEATAVPEPTDKVVLDGSYTIYIPGVGGTGVVTVNALLAYAALLENKSLLSLDQTGLAQKGGAVLSNLMLVADGQVTSNKVGMGAADLYLALDALGGMNPINLDRTDPQRTVAVVNTTLSPTGEMIRNNSLLFPSEDTIRHIIDPCTQAARNLYLDAGTIAESLFDDHMATNIFLIGVTYQAGLLPLKAESIEGAIELNGVAVQQNLQAFRYGRHYLHDPQTIIDRVLPGAKTTSDERADMLERLGSQQARQYEQLLSRCGHLDAEAQRMLAIRVGELIDYQSVPYATKYVDFVLQVAEREAAVCPNQAAFTHAVIRHLYKLMAYKDEYEVARLHLKAAWQYQLDSMFQQPLMRYYHLHPPLLRAMGVKRKLKLGPWFDHPLRMLVKMKKLRGTFLDIFGYAEVRREERQLISWYRHTIELVLEHLDDDRHALAVLIANAPDTIRGYEEIKLRRIDETKNEVAQHLANLAIKATEMSSAISLPVLPNG